MSRNATAIATLAILCSISHAQTIRPDWRRIGNSVYDAHLPGPAGGPIERVWYAEDGSALFVRTASGATFRTADFESWNSSDVQPPAVSDALAYSEPETQPRLRAARYQPERIYAAGVHAWRSDDGGRTWTNLTSVKTSSILGDSVRDLAVSPRNGDEIVAANGYGVWRSLDGGLTWSGLNEGLPNLPVRRILAVPMGNRAARVLLDAPSLSEVRWRPGEKHAWQPAPDAQSVREAELRLSLTRRLGAEITAVAEAGSFLYAGSADGRLWAMPDSGRAPTPWASDNGPVAAIYIDPADSRLAYAALSGPKKEARVVRTNTGGAYWDDLSRNLPDGSVYSVAAERNTGAVYAGSDRGVFLNLNGNWVNVSAGLPAGRVIDIRLDAAGNQIYAALAGHGLYGAIAPHRLRAVELVSAADLAPRAAAPGALMTVLGGRVRNARTGDLVVPVLDASDNESHIQVPFEVSGSALALALETSDSRLQVGVPLQTAAPAIFVDREGAPFLIDADSGVMLSAMTPARPGARLQILASGLGKVTPEWPTGLAAPLDDTPRVLAEVKVYLDRVPVNVTSSTLAPGYTGFYLIEANMPDIVNAGPAELYIEAGGFQSNRVTVFLQP
jgi:uncharacterized protein (TIGR03437 family)